jgi:hypothetical protein
MLARDVEKAFLDSGAVVLPIAEPPVDDIPMPTEYPESADGIQDLAPEIAPAAAGMITPLDWPDEAPPPISPASLPKAARAAPAIGWGMRSRAALWSS